MSHDARAVANVLIDKSIEAGSPFTPLQIIKLVYFCHCWMLGLYGRPLIKQPIEAWQYGPVVPEVYRALKKYGGDPVTERIPNVPDEDFDELELDLIDQVYEEYGKLSGYKLSTLTHVPQTPWFTVWSEKGQNSRIPDELIQQHYAEIAK